LEREVRPQAAAQAKAQEHEAQVTDREFWTLVYRALLMLASAVKKRWLEAPVDK